MVINVMAVLTLFCSQSHCQQLSSTWEEQVRRCAEVQDWTGAMTIVDREIARAPHDIDVRAWRARVLAWSGSLKEAEVEYTSILAAEPRDPDNWLGIGNVYLRLGRIDDAIRAFDHAVELDPKRPDLRVARARALQAAHQKRDAQREFQSALDLDPGRVDAIRGLISLRGEARHELRLGVNDDLFNFTDQNHDGEISIASRWTSHLASRVAWTAYDRGGTNAEKFTGSLTARGGPWGALTAGGASARDHGVIPESEAFFDYDRGWRLKKNGPVRGFEVVYGQHWYWYTTARIFALNGTGLVYLPKDWTWSLRLTGARSHFAGADAEWRPSGLTKLTFPIAGWHERKLGGNVFFAVGTENFAQLDQIWRFSSQTYGGGLRFQWTARQDLTGFAAYQRRTQDRTETSLGASYGIRF